MNNHTNKSLTDNKNIIAPLYLSILGIGLISFASILIYICYVLLPDNGEKWVYLFGLKAYIEKESRLALLVILSGALGSFIHTATSFSRYIGHNKFYRRWLWWYILRPFIGSALALIFYFVIRGGLFTSTASNEINLYGILAISGMVGMFSKQATDKLNDLFTNLFKTEKEEDNIDSISDNQHQKDNPI
jgi:hypothetical protein